MFIILSYFQVEGLQATLWDRQDQLVQDKTLLQERITEMSRRETELVEETTRLRQETKTARGHMANLHKRATTFEQRMMGAQATITTKRDSLHEQVYLVLSFFFSL